MRSIINCFRSRMAVMWKPTNHVHPCTEEVHSRALIICMQLDTITKISETRQNNNNTLSKTWCETDAAYYSSSSLTQRRRYIIAHQANQTNRSYECTSPIHFLGHRLVTRSSLMERFNGQSQNIVIEIFDRSNLASRTNRNCSAPPRKTKRSSDEDAKNSDNYHTPGLLQVRWRKVEFVDVESTCLIHSTTSVIFDRKSRESFVEDWSI